MARPGLDFVDEVAGGERTGRRSRRRRSLDWKGKLNQALALLGIELRRARRSDRETYVRLFGAGAVRERRFYNVGAGAFRHPCWTNIDHASDWYAAAQAPFVEHDLMGPAPLPIATASAEIIYSSHVIEHLTDASVSRFFAEAYRALRPGGVIRITTGPDADLDLAALRRGDVDWFYWDRSDRPIELKWLHHVSTALAPHDPTPIRKLGVEDVRAGLDDPEFLDRLVAMVPYRPSRPGNHVSWWNGGKLLRFMREAGFNAYRSGYGQSACPVLRNTRFFDHVHPQISVYAEAVR